MSPSTRSHSAGNSRRLHGDPVRRRGETGSTSARAAPGVLTGGSQHGPKGASSAMVSELFDGEGDLHAGPVPAQCRHVQHRTQDRRLAGDLQPAEPGEVSFAQLGWDQRCEALADQGPRRPAEELAGRR